MKTHKTFTTLNKYLKIEILDFINSYSNVDEYLQISKIFGNHFLNSIKSRTHISRLCIDLIKRNHDFNNNLWRNSMFEVFINDELYFYSSKDLMNSWSEPLMNIFLDCFEEYPILDEFRSKVAEFLELFRHYENLYLKILKKKWDEEKNQEDFNSIFYLKSGFNLLEYYNMKRFILDGF